MNINDCWFASSYTQIVKDAMNDLKNSEKNLEKIQEENEKQKLQLSQNTQQEINPKDKNSLIDILA